MKMLLFAASFAVLSSSSPVSGAHLRNAVTVYYADAYADHYRVPRALVHAIIGRESGWNPRAVSAKGAAGLMQLMPATAEGYGVVNPYAMTENLTCIIREFPASGVLGDVRSRYALMGARGCCWRGGGRHYRDS